MMPHFINVLHQNCHRQQMTSVRIIHWLTISETTKFSIAQEDSSERIASKLFDAQAKGCWNMGCPMIEDYGGRLSLAHRRKAIELLIEGGLSSLIYTCLLLFGIDLVQSITSWTWSLNGFHQHRIDMCDRWKHFISSSLQAWSSIGSSHATTAVSGPFVSGPSLTTVKGPTFEAPPFEKKTDLLTP
jgi:hypothetical protein